MTPSGADVNKFIEILACHFEANKATDIATQHYRIHIDRQLPFLIFYRKCDETSQATLDILSTFSSYILIPADDQYIAQNKKLINAIVELQKKYFEGSLLIEIWFKPLSHPLTKQGEPKPQKFSIKAFSQNLSHATLESLEAALQQIILRKRNAIVDVNYEDSIAPPGIKALFDNTQSEPKVSFLGIEIEEMYQSIESDQIFPFAIKKLKDGLNRAIKKAVYTFSHESTLFKPENYHVLGRRSLTKLVWQCDKALTDISESFDLLLHVTPVNTSQAWKEFKRSHYQKTPIFHYRPRTVDPSLLKRKLYNIPIEDIEDPALNSFFTSKRDELDEQIGLLHKRELSQFLFSSIQIFGVIDKGLLTTAKNILCQQSTVDQIYTSELLSADQFAAHAEQTMDYYRKIDPQFTATVTVRNDITGILVSHGNFLIGTDAQVSKSRLSATLSHEIGTHVLTYHNGIQQPFSQLYSGMAGYEELQEGLAVLGEYFSDGLTHDRLVILAARVIAVDSIIKGASFVETYNVLTDEYGIYPHSAFYTTMRVYRGGGYTKDMIYLRGLLHLLQLISKDIDFNLLFTGKISFEYLPLIEELYWREIIKPPVLLPQYLATESAQRKMSTIKKSPKLDTIMEGL